MKKTLIFMMVVALSGCSLSDSKKDVPAVRADDVEFAVDTIDEQVAPTEDINVKAESIAEAKIPDEY